MYIKGALLLRCISPIDQDIPYIQSVLLTIQQAQTSLQPYPDLRKEIPLVVVDHEVIKHE
jgi:hypothetical protein